jgi:hypothetical protein
MKCLQIGRFRMQPTCGFLLRVKIRVLEARKFVPSGAPSRVAAWKQRRTSEHPSGLTGLNLRSQTANVTLIHFVLGCVCRRAYQRKRDDIRNDPRLDSAVAIARAAVVVGVVVPAVVLRDAVVVMVVMARHRGGHRSCGGDPQHSEGGSDPGLHCGEHRNSFVGWLSFM